MSAIVTIPAKRLKLDSSPYFKAEKDTSRMGRESWLNLRLTGLGGTDMAAVMFPDDRKGPLSVYVEKVGGVVDAFEGNDFTDYGQILEEALRNTFLPTKLVRIGLSPSQFRIWTSPYFYRSNDSPWLTANVDGIIEFDTSFSLEDGTLVPEGTYVLELKTAGLNQRRNWEDGSIPDRYYAQAQHYANGLRLDGAIIFGLVDRTPELRFVPRHDEFTVVHKEMGDKMWEAIATRTPPPAFGGLADLSALQSIYPNAGTAMVEHLGLTVLAKQYLEAKDRMNRAEADVKSYQAQFKGYIGENSGLMDGVSSVKWSRWETTRVDYKTLEAENPDIVARYKTKKSPGNRLTVKVEGRDEE